MKEPRGRTGDRSSTSRYRARLGWTRLGSLFLGSTLVLRSAAAAALLEGEDLPSQRPGVQVQLDPCLAVDRNQVERLLLIELPAQLVPPGPAPPATVQARASCTELGVELRVDDPITGKSLRRTIDLTRAAEAIRPRLLALALAELTFTSWTELLIRLRPEAPTPAPEVPAGNPEQVPEATLQAARQAVREKLPATSPGLYAAGVGSALALFAGTGVLFGGGVTLGYDHTHHLGWSFDMLVHHGTTTSEIGSLAADVMSAGVALLFHGRVVQRRTYSFDLRAGGGVRGGAVRLAGFPNPGSTTEQGATVWGPYAGPLVTLSGRLNLPHRLTAELSVEGGYVAVPVGGRVDGTRVFAVEGPWLGIQIGLGVGGK